MAGARAMAAMKHFGMNVASDAVFPSVYIGATGGLVYVCADDPGMNSSGTEPDSRHFAPPHEDAHAGACRQPGVQGLHQAGL